MNSGNMASTEHSLAIADEIERRSMAFNASAPGQAKSPGPKDIAAWVASDVADFKRLTGSSVQVDAADIIATNCGKHGGYRAALEQQSPPTARTALAIHEISTRVEQLHERVKQIDGQAQQQGQRNPAARPVQGADAERFAQRVSAGLEQALRLHQVPLSVQPLVRRMVELELRVRAGEAAHNRDRGAKDAAIAPAIVPVIAPSKAPAAKLAAERSW